MAFKYARITMYSAIGRGLGKCHLKYFQDKK